MGCYLCGSDKFIEILNRPSIPVWINLTKDDPMHENIMHKCILLQCVDCGHVYQPMDEKIKHILSNMYTLPHAAGPTPMGKGNWGLQRANIFLQNINKRDYKSAIEIGCSDGYMLRCLKEKGVTRLAGIDPSIEKSRGIDGISFLKEQIREDLVVGSKYDLIFSSAVFEHIEDINGVIRFCRNNLSENGELFFSVPNTQRQLISGDPGLFLHQHIHYFTESSLRYLLSKNGFKVKEIRQSESSIDTMAEIDDACELEIASNITLYSEYATKLEKILSGVCDTLNKYNVLVHGANNSLYNTLSYLKKEFKFDLVDNDINKQRKRYFGRTVRSIDDIDLICYNIVLIAAVSFYETIVKEYIDKGFKGKFKKITAVEGVACLS